MGNKVDSGLFVVLAALAVHVIVSVTGLKVVGKTILPIKKLPIKKNIKVIPPEKGANRINNWDFGLSD